MTASPSLFGTAGRTDPVALPCGQLPLAIVGALCGPAALRTAAPRGSKRLALRFEHSSTGMLELLVAAGDERAHRTIRALRDDRNAYARVLAVLACAVELDGQTGRFRFESVHQLTHGPRPPQINRSRLNAPVDDLLQLLSVLEVRWTAPTSSGRRAMARSYSGPLLTLEVSNRMARTVTLSGELHRLLTYYSLQVTPQAFLVTAQPGAPRGPAAPVLARLRLGALIAARWRNGHQKITAGDVFTRFAWLPFGSPAGPDGAAAEAVVRTLLSRLRETVEAVEAELRYPARYGAGLLAPVTIPKRAPLRAMLTLGLPPARDEPATPATDAASHDQPTLDEARLRDASTPRVFEHITAPESIPGDQNPGARTIADNQDAGRHSLADGQDDMSESIACDQDAPASDVAATRGSALGPAGLRTATVALRELESGRVAIGLGGDVELVLPASVALAAGLVSPSNSMVGSQEPSPESDGDSIGDVLQDDLSRPQHLPKSRRGDQDDQRAARRDLSVSGPESSSDDSDRARGNRLAAALAPHQQPPRRRAAPADNPKQRRTA